MGKTIQELNALDETTIAEDALLLVTNDDGASYKITLEDLRDALLATGVVVEDDLASEAVSNAKLKTGAGEPGGAWNSWAPTWTNLTIGNAVVSCKYKQIGKTVHCRILVAYGSSSSSSANTVVQGTLPVAEHADYASLGCPVGMVKINDTGNGNYPGYIRLPGSGKFDMITFSANGTWATEYGMPAALANGDVFYGSFTYQAA